MDILACENLFKAKSPSYSAWVNASAGTGKTRLLTERVINLLINNIEPENILCLTFTKAAKGEMLSRINENLYRWSNIDEISLKVELKEIYNQTFNSKQLLDIKNLYNKNSTQSQKIRIYTIHAFCQHILQKFPIESGIKTSFRVIGEKESQNIINKIILSNNFLEEMPTDLLDFASLFSFKDLIIETIHQLQKQEFTNSNIHNSYKTLFNLESSCIQLEDPLIALQQDMKKICSLINIANSELGSLISNFLKSDKQDILEKFNELKGFFITLTGQPRKKLIKNNSPDNHLIEQLNNIQGMILVCLESVNAISITRKSILLQTISEKVISFYTAYKKENNLLDYEDLIKYTNYLLSQSHMREWVKYKLDGGIDHILVDESQDTSISQWKIIHSLLNDFFSGEGASKKEKTIFVVGDIKQSIYSFQGARPDLFIPTKILIKNQCLNAKKNFLDIELKTTYRLPKGIYDFIDKLFKNNENIDPLASLECHKSNDYSKIEILNLTPKEEIKKLFWPNPTLFQKITLTELEHAKKIATYVKKILDDELYIQSKNRKVEPQDFMILLQKRSKLNSYISSELTKLGIGVAGLDRVNLSESIAIKDLLSIVKFIINPHDNLNIASLLKSPYIGLTDQDLKSYIGQKNWYKVILSENSKILNKLHRFKQLASELDIYNFFLALIDENQIIEKYSRDSLFDQIDAIKLFLDEVSITTVNGTNTSLYEIVLFFQEGGNDIKRDLSSSLAVKIMTIHAVKGLESPIVILADANDFINNTSSGIEYFTSENNNILPIWSNSLEKNQTVINIKTKHKIEAIQEYTRLLYVALTRAQDRLVIAGIENSSENESWYRLCRNTAANYFTEEDGMLQYEHGAISIINQTIALSQKSTYKYRKETNNRQQTLVESKKNSKINFYEDAHLGILIHKFFENYLINSKNIKNFISQNLNLHIGIDSNQLEYLLDKASKNQYLEELIKKECKHEVEIALKQNNKITIMRIDLLVIDEKDILIIDFKSDHEKTYITLYKEKLNQYKNAIQMIYPNNNIIIKIFWIRLNEWETL